MGPLRRMARRTARRAVIGAVIAGAVAGNARAKSNTQVAPATTAQTVQATDAFCINCGEKLGPDLKFCPKCGTPKV